MVDVWTVTRVRSLALILIFAGAVPATAQPAPPTNTWTLPGSSPGGLIAWSVGPWDVVPTFGGSTATVLQFNSTSASPFTAANDLGTPFQANGLILNGSSATATITIDDLGSNQIALRGPNPFFYQSGSSPVNVLSLLTLQPEEGTTTFGGDGTGPVIINSPIVGFGGVTKAGTGTLVLNQESSVNGGFVVSGGTLRIMHSGSSATGSGPISIQSGGTVTGTGYVEPSFENGITVHAGGTFAPGDGENLGVFTAVTTNGNFSFESGSHWAIRLGAPENGGGDTAPDTGGNSSGDPGSNASHLQLFQNGAGVLTLDPDTIVVLRGSSSNFNLDRSYSFRVADVPEGSTGSVTSPDNFDTSGFMDLETVSLNVVGDGVYLNFTTPVPEPSAVLLTAALGVGVLTASRRLARLRRPAVE